MTRPSFRPIAAPLGVDDTALARLSDQLGVPKLVNPGAATPITGEIPAAGAQRPEPRPSPTPKTPTAKKTAPASTPVKLSAMVPGYVSDALNLRAAQERSTVRHLVLLGLQAIGFEIAEADLIADARRPKRKRR